MNRLPLLLLTVVLTACTAPTPPATPDVVERVEPTNVADLIDRVGASVVNITTVSMTTGGVLGMLLPDGTRGPRQRTGAGTGFIIDASGYVVTNAHVIQGADEVRVRLRDDREFAARVVGRDRKLDLALIKIANTDALPTVDMGNSASVRVGESVFAVGNPYGLGHTVTMGIVSAKARAIGASAYDDFIQTDASINPGNSGGPLFNLRGEVVGINTAVHAAADGIGFAIPINTLKDVLEQLKKKGFVERGLLGLLFQSVTPEIAQAVGMSAARGAMVSEILRDGAAERAGIQSGDIVVQINETPIAKAEDLPRTIAKLAPGSAITVRIWRDKQEMEVKATLDRMEGDPPPTPIVKSPRHGNQVLGVAVDNAPGGGARIVALHKPIKGLRVGDVIVELDRQPVGNVKELKSQLTTTKDRKSVLLRVRRGKRHRYIGVPLQ